jgi:hypothetical protein
VRVTPGSNAGERYWEGEWVAGREMIGGSRLAVREGRGELGWVGSGRFGPAGFPGAAQVGSWPLSFILFSFCFLFLLF